MQKFNTLATSRLAVLIGGAVLAVGLIWPLIGTAQDKRVSPPGDPGKAATANPNKQLAEQIRLLNAKVVRLEATLKQDRKGTPSGTPDKGGLEDRQDKTGGDPPGGRVSARFQNCLQCHQTKPSGPLPPSHLEKAGGSDTGMVEGRAAAGQREPQPDKGMGMMGGKGMGMGMMDEGMGMMGGKSMGMGMMGDAKKPAGGMGMMDMDEEKGMGALGGGKAGMGGMSSGMEDMDMMEMMGMMGMAPKSVGGMTGMKSMGKMQMEAALPGFPGASHIYHIGATDFFLNHSEHITLTPKQHDDLVRLKEKAVLEKTSAQRQIDEAEQELWVLTSADEPGAAEIGAKIQEIEKLRGDQRMALIRAVGAATELLTDEQRQSLLGTGTDETAKPDRHADHQGPPSATPGQGDEADMQDKMPDPAEQNDAGTSAADLSAEVRELQARIAELEAAAKARP